MTAQSPGLRPHSRRHQQQGKHCEEEGSPASCPVPLSQTVPSWVGQKMENIFNKTRWEEAPRLWATSGLEEPGLSCSGCFWGGCPLPSSNKSQGFLAVSGEGVFQSKALPVGGREERWKEYERGIGRWIRRYIHVSCRIHRKGT